MVHPHTSVFLFIHLNLICVCSAIGIGSISGPELDIATLIVKYDYQCNYSEKCWDWIFNSNLDCKNKGLTCIPSWFKPVPKALDYQHNQMRVIPDHIFRDQYRVLSDLSLVEKIDLSFNYLQYMAPNAFIGLNSLKTLNLNYNLFKESPKEALASSSLAESLTTLYLMGNPLVQLKNQEFSHLANLKELDLRYCKLTELNSETFEGLRRLEILHLAGNRLATIKPNTFHSLRNLDSLFLDDNDIRILSNEAFKGPYHLKTLSLKNNPVYFNNTVALSTCLPCMPRMLGAVKQISSNYSTSGKNEQMWDLTVTVDPKSPKIRLLPKNVIRHHFPDDKMLRKLQQLVLSSVGIERINPGAFSELPALVILDLSDNSILNVPKEAWDDISELLFLSLKRNPISKLNPREFVGLPKLQVLDLQYCDIAEIERNSFEGLDALQHLRLGGNKLTVVEGMTFSNLRRLENLLLNGNEIGELRHGDFEGLNGLRRLDLSGNPLKTKMSPAIFQSTQGVKDPGIALRETVIKNTTNEETVRCNCDERRNLCVGFWKFDGNSAECVLEPSMIRIISKFAAVNVSELVASGFVLMMLGFLIQQMLVNYNNSPM